jgi:hypothetical protein
MSPLRSLNTFIAFKLHSSAWRLLPGGGKGGAGRVADVFLFFPMTLENQISVPCVPIYCRLDPRDFEKRSLSTPRSPRPRPRLASFSAKPLAHIGIVSKLLLWEYQILNKAKSVTTTAAKWVVVRRSTRSASVRPATGELLRVLAVMASMICLPPHLGKPLYNAIRSHRPTH